MIFEIIELLLRFGFNPNRTKMMIVYQYLYSMMKGGRVIAIREDDRLIGFATYSMTDIYDAIYEKSMWDFIPHNEAGKYAYIEMIVCEKWDRKLRNLIEDAIANHYPDFEAGVWHRPSKNHDRLLIVRRKHNVPGKSLNK